jgi:hypothetical protein
MTIPRFWQALLASAALFTFILGQLASCNHEGSQAKGHLKLVIIFCESPVAGLAVVEEGALMMVASGTGSLARLIPRKARMA